MQIQAVLKKYDILFVVDEVICAFGRLGTMFPILSAWPRYRHIHLKLDFPVVFFSSYSPFPLLLNFDNIQALSSVYVPVGAVLMSPEFSDVIYSQSNKLGWW